MPRLLDGRECCTSGAGVLCTVLALRERDLVATAGAGSTLAAFPREVGREDARDGGRRVGSTSGVGVGVAAADVLRRVIVVEIAAGLLSSFFESFLLSLVGGKIGVEAFFGDGSLRDTLGVAPTGARAGTVDSSPGVGGTEGIEVLLRWLPVVAKGAGTGVSVLVFFCGLMAGLEPSPSFFTLSVSAVDSLLRFFCDGVFAGILLGLSGPLVLPLVAAFEGGLAKRPFIALAASAIFRADSSASSAASFASSFASFA